MQDFVPKSIMTWIQKKKKERKKVQRQPRSAPSIFLSLKILTAFGQHKPQGLVFISSRYIYFGFALGLHFQVKYIFHLCWEDFYSWKVKLVV